MFYWNPKAWLLLSYVNNGNDKCIDAGFWLVEHPFLTVTFFSLVPNPIQILKFKILFTLFTCWLNQEEEAKHIGSENKLAHPHETGKRKEPDTWFMLHWFPKGIQHGTACPIMDNHFCPLTPGPTADEYVYSTACWWKDNQSQINMTQSEKGSLRSM